MLRVRYRMGHATVDNKTDFAVEQLFSLDEEGRSLFVPLVQASFHISRRGLVPLEPAPDVKLGGEVWQPTDPATGSTDPPAQTDGVISWRIEPHFAFTKTATDVVMVGHAHARRGGVTEVSVGLKVGQLEKAIVVRGDRVWVQAAGSITPSKPQPFERIPLRYERAFGGWDRSDPEPSKHTPFRPNPVGVGYHPDNDPFSEGMRVPNLEDPANPLKQWGQIVPPVGFGFLATDWEPRSNFAGTYDEAWMKDRMPLLPSDFDRRFFNAASPGLVAPGYLRGDETVAISGASAAGQLSFALPGIQPPKIRCELVHQIDVPIETNLDTLIIDTDAETLTLLFRGFTKLRDSPHDVLTVEVTA